MPQVRILSLRPNLALESNFRSLFLCFLRRKFWGLTVYFPSALFRLLFLFHRQFQNKSVKQIEYGRKHERYHKYRHKRSLAEKESDCRDRRLTRYDSYDKTAYREYQSRRKHGRNCDLYRASKSLFLIERLSVLNIVRWHKDSLTDKMSARTALWILSTIYPKSLFFTKRHKRLDFQGFSGISEPFTRKAEKGNCKNEAQICNSVFEVWSG